MSNNETLHGIIQLTHEEFVKTKKSNKELAKQLAKEHPDKEFFLRVIEKTFKDGYQARIVLVTKGGRVRYKGQLYDCKQDLVDETELDTTLDGTYNFCKTGDGKKCTHQLTVEKMPYKVTEEHKKAIRITALKRRYEKASDTIGTLAETNGLLFKDLTELLDKVAAIRSKMTSNENKINAIMQSQTAAYTELKSLGVDLAKESGIELPFMKQ